MPSLAFRLALPGLILLLSACAGVPELRPTTSQETAAVQLLDASMAAHGGDAYAELETIAVSYDGEWGRAIRRIQPVIVDIGYRKRSEERLLLGRDEMLQRFEGPDGVKTVRRQGDDVTVAYFPPAGQNADPRPANDDERNASAMVADAYELFLLGPSFLKRHAAQLQLLEPETLDGQLYDRLLVHIRPGLGPGSDDRVLAWIDRDSRRLFRILFTIDGLPSTQGAAIDVTYHDYRQVGGLWWATRYVERVRSPFRVFAHRWWITGLDVDRPAPEGSVTSEVVRQLIETPAAPLPSLAGKVEAAP